MLLCSEPVSNAFARHHLQKSFSLQFCHFSVFWFCLPHLFISSSASHHAMLSLRVISGYF